LQRAPVREPVLIPGKRSGLTFAGVKELSSGGRPTEDCPSIGYRAATAPLCTPYTVELDEWLNSSEVREAVPVSEKIEKAEPEEIFAAPTPA
jgi:hypothetical protein